MKTRTGSSLLPAAVLGFLTIGAGGCSTMKLTPEASGIKEVNATAVSGCKFVMKVRGTSGWEGYTASNDLVQARREALNLSAAEGVTHVVWDAASKEGYLSVTGLGYTCPPPAPPAK